MNDDITLSTDLLESGIDNTGDMSVNLLNSDSSSDYSEQEYQNEDLPIHHEYQLK